MAGPAFASGGDDDGRDVGRTRCNRDGRGGTANRRDPNTERSSSVPASKQFAIVITHVGVRKDLLTMDWLEKDYRVDESDWIVLSKEEWRAVARGEPLICQALARRLLIGHYVNQPELIAIIGHPHSARTVAETGSGQCERERVTFPTNGGRAVLISLGPPRTVRG
jgi:hypothetical protein